MINRPIVTLDNYTTFNYDQTKKVNSLVLSQYKKFLNKTMQKQQNEDKTSVAVIAQTGRVGSCSSFEYNGTGFATFQLITMGMVSDIDYPIIQVKNKIKKIICYGGSSYEEMYDDITDFGYFFAKDNIIYFRIITDFDTFLYPYCNITWSY